MKRTSLARVFPLALSLSILLGSLSACRNTEPATPDPTPPETASSTPAPTAQPMRSGLDRTPDLNCNGIPEELKLLEGEDGSLTLQVLENGEVILWEPGEPSYPSAEFLYTKDGVDCLLRYKTWNFNGQNCYGYSYELVTFPNGSEESVQRDSVDFDLNFGTPYHRDFDPEAIAGLVEQVNGLLPHCELLFCTAPDLTASFERAGAFRDDLSWLDDFPEVFTRDPGKSLLENLRAFQKAMPADWEPPAPQPGASLPIDKPLELVYSSGAGAWSTDLTLNPDGTFTGNYHDADGATYYVCQFHGRFGNFAPLTAFSWYMTLEELVLDTGRPVGEAWDEVPDWYDGNIHFISSEPNGFTGGDGNILTSGAGFLFYLPGATGHQPGTELYGAMPFLFWMPSRHAFHSATDTLGCYGLNNLTTGDGFFSSH